MHRVERIDGASEMWTRAGPYLRMEPVLNNVLLTVLHARMRRPESAEYWIAVQDGRVVGALVQSPVSRPANLGVTDPRVARALASEMRRARIELPGASGDVDSVEGFVTAWTEDGAFDAVPERSLRIHELRPERFDASTAGRVRRAGPVDLPLVTEWLAAFLEETHDRAADAAALALERVEAGQIWLYDQGGPRSMAGHSPGIEGVTRIQAVYTPARHRNRGYGRACATGVSGRLLDSGLRCMLYTDATNPTSNHVFHSIGYRVVAESVKCNFRARA